MDTIKILSDDVKMIAHRGVSGIEVENTIPSFLLAAKKSYYGIETDLHVTLDNKYIICHDDNIKRVTGIDKVIEETTFEELRQIKVLNYGGLFVGDIYLPTLEEYINICKNSNKIAVLELKNEMKECCIKEIVDIITKLNYFPNTIFISFSKENIKHLRNNFADSNCQYLAIVDTDEKKEDAINFAHRYKVNLDLYHNGINSDFVNKCHKKGILINVWTVDDVNLAKKLIDFGVDFITSNILE